MSKDSKVKDSKTPKEEEKQKDIPINKYSIYEIKAAIDTKIVEVIFNFLNKFIKQVFRKTKIPWKSLFKQCEINNGNYLSYFYCNCLFKSKAFPWKL